MSAVKVPQKEPTVAPQPRLIEIEIEATRQRLVAAGDRKDWTAARRHLKRFEYLLRKRRPELRPAPGPEHARVILDRLWDELLIAWETRGRPQ